MGYTKEGILQNIDGFVGEVTLVKNNALIVWIDLMDACKKDVDDCIKRKGNVK